MIFTKNSFSNVANATTFLSNLSNSLVSAGWTLDGSGTGAAYSYGLPASEFIAVHNANNQYFTIALVPSQLSGEEDVYFRLKICSNTAYSSSNEWYAQDGVLNPPYTAQQARFQLWTSSSTWSNLFTQWINFTLTNQDVLCSSTACYIACNLTDFNGFLYSNVDGTGSYYDDDTNNQYQMPNQTAFSFFGQTENFNSTGTDAREGIAIFQDTTNQGGLNAERLYCFSTTQMFGIHYANYPSSGYINRMGEDYRPIIIYKGEDIHETAQASLIKWTVGNYLVNYQTIRLNTISNAIYNESFSRIQLEPVFYTADVTEGEDTYPSIVGKFHHYAAAINGQIDFGQDESIGVKTFSLYPLFTPAYSDFAMAIRTA